MAAPDSNARFQSIDSSLTDLAEKKSGKVNNKTAYHTANELATAVGSYDNTTSGLTATTIQAAIDENAAAAASGGYTYTEVAVPQGVAATSGILGMGTVPVELLPAPGANKYYEYKGVIEYTYNGTVYVLTGVDEAIVVGNYNLYAGSYIQNDLLTNNASSVAFFSSDAFANDEFTNEPVSTNTASGASYPFPLNEAIQMFTWNATDPTTGNGTILVKIWYKVKTFGTEL